MDDPAPAAKASDEHHIGALMLAIASLSHEGYVKIRHGTAGAWRVASYSPRARGGARGIRHAYLSTTGETLRHALETMLERLRAEQACMGQGREA